MTVDTIGQDLAFNYLVSMQFELKGGTQTMCAMAAAPCDLRHNLLNTLKLILANSKHMIKPGAQIGIMDMMTTSNDMDINKAPLDGHFGVGARVWATMSGACSSVT